MIIEVEGFEQLFAEEEIGPTHLRLYHLIEMARLEQQPNSTVSRSINVRQSGRSPLGLAFRPATVGKGAGKFVRARYAGSGCRAQVGPKVQKGLGPNIRISGDGVKGVRREHLGTARGYRYLKMLVAQRMRVQVDCADKGASRNDAEVIHTDRRSLVTRLKAAKSRSSSSTVKWVVLFSNRACNRGHMTG
eukprot:1175949-Prorocentrum_minimum.AAC.8